MTYLHTQRTIKKRLIEPLRSAPHRKQPTLDQAPDHQMRMLPGLDERCQVVNVINLLRMPHVVVGFEELVLGLLQVGALRIDPGVPDIKVKRGAKILA